MAGTPVKGVLRHVKPLVSSNKEEAKKATLNLFKSWCRTLPYIIVEYEVPLSIKEAQKRVKQEFLKHQNITDIRVIDMLILKSNNELYDLKNRIRSTSQFYYKYKESLPPPPKDFMSKFFSGKD